MFEELGNSNESSSYSDLTDAGGLGRAIQAQLKAIGSALCVKKPDSEFSRSLPFDWEVVEEKQRFSQISIAKHQRLFMVDFWDRGVCLAHASTPTLPKVAEAINAWIAEESWCGELQRQFPFEGDSAEAIELILQHLPPNCGPAIQGTADHLYSPRTQAD
jgi:hypothetical protein